MKSTFSILLGLSVIVLYGHNLARAELDPSPATITGVIVGAGTKQITLRLEDGKTEVKVAREGNFPENSDFTPGRILTVAVIAATDGRAPTDTTDEPPPVKDATLLKLIDGLQQNSKHHANRPAHEKSTLDALLDFTSMRPAHALTSSPPCDPFREDGAVLNIDKSPKTSCFYGETNQVDAACAPQTVTAVGKLEDISGASNMLACDPLVFGQFPRDVANKKVDQSLCMFKNVGGDCNEIFFKECDARGLQVSECQKKFVLPYAKAHYPEFKGVADRLQKVCSGKYDKFLTKLHDCKFGYTENGSWITLDSIELSRRAIAKAAASLARCELVAGDPVNGNVTESSGLTPASFTTVEAKGCSTKSVCVRDIQCKRLGGGSEKRLARCASEFCGSAAKCLADSSVSGSSNPNLFKK